MDKYWFILYPETFLWIKTKKALLYHSVSGEHIGFNLSGKITEICNTLNNPDNLYSVLIVKGEDKEADTWVEEVCKRNLGKVVDFTDPGYKPISLPPLLHVEDETPELGYIYEITFHMGGREKKYKEYYKQFNHPLYSENNLSAEKVIHLLKRINGYNLQKVNFTGIEFLEKEQIETLIKNLSLYTFKKNFITNIKHIEFYKDLLTLVPDSKLTFICYSLQEYVQCREKTDLLNVQYIYPLASEAELEEIEQENFSSLTIKPVYTGDNLQFFEDNIFISAEDILESRVDKRTIFMNQKVNCHFFGKLTVLPDGKVYANLYREALGEIEDPIYELLEKEFARKESWLYIRNEKPCCDCVYQWLCPAPGNYELAIKKTNLCNVI